MFKIIVLIEHNNECCYKDNLLNQNNVLDLLKLLNI